MLGKDMVCFVLAQKGVVSSPIVTVEVLDALNPWK